MARTTQITFSPEATTPPLTGEVAIAAPYQRRRDMRPASTLQRVRSTTVTLQGWRLGLSGSALVTLTLSTVVAWAVQR